MYQLRGRLGRWGLGEIYEAVHQETGRVVMLKLVRGRRAGDPHVKRHMTCEYETAGAVDHPGLVKILALEELPELGLFHVMELVPGDTLGDQLKRGVTFLPEKAAALCVEVAAALGALHTAGRAHFELCPQAIFVPASSTGEGLGARLINFGLPPATASNEPRPQLPLEALPYAAPERRAGAAWDHRADIYSLCAVLIQLLVGQNPPPQGFRKLPALPAGASPLEMDLFEAASKGLVPDPQERYSESHALANVLELCARPTSEKPEAEPVSAPAVSRPAKPAVMKKTILGMAALGPQAGSAVDTGKAAEPAQAAAPPQAPTLRSAPEPAPPPAAPQPPAVPAKTTDPAQPERVAEPPSRKKKSAAHIRGKKTVLGVGSVVESGAPPPVPVKAGPPPSGPAQRPSAPLMDAVAGQPGRDEAEPVPVPALAADELSAEPLEGEPTVVAEPPPVPGAPSKPSRSKTGEAPERPQTRPPKAALLFTAGHTLKGETFEDVAGDAPLDASTFSTSATGSQLALDDDLPQETEAVELVGLRRRRSWVWLAGLGVFLIGAGALALALLEPWKTGSEKKAPVKVAGKDGPARASGGARDGGVKKATTPDGGKVAGRAGDGGVPPDSRKVDAGLTQVAVRPGEDAGTAAPPTDPPDEPHRLTRTQKYKAFLKEGRRAMRKRKYGLARKLFTKALKIRRGSYRATLYMGEAHYKSREYWAAVYWYQKVLKKSSKSASVHVRLGKAYAKVGKRSLGCKHFLKAFRLRPNSKRYRRVVENYRCR